MNKVQFGKNEFCGPSCISAIAGINTDEASAVLSSITGRSKITGVYPSELEKAFNILGYNVEGIPSLAGSTIFSSLFQLHGKDGYYVFTIPGHFVAIELNGNHKYICDNHSKSPINVSSSARLGQRVQRVVKVTKR